jgi:hypothetical protein
MVPKLKWLHPECGYRQQEGQGSSRQN